MVRKSSLNPNAAPYVPISQRENAEKDSKNDDAPPHHDDHHLPESNTASSSPHYVMQWLEAKADEDIALLKTMLPHTPEQSLSDVYFFNNGDLHKTIDMLKELQVSVAESSKSAETAATASASSNPKESSTKKINFKYRMAEKDFKNPHATTSIPLSKTDNQDSKNDDESPPHPKILRTLEGEGAEVHIAYLKMQFPDISEQSLRDVYMANDEDIDNAIDMLNQLKDTDDDSSVTGTLDTGNASESAAPAAETSASSNPETLAEK